MLAYCLYSEAGGVGKTTLAANLSVAHARNDRDVLAIDLDPQDAGLSYLLDVDGNRSSSEDSILEHLVATDSTPLQDLIETAEYGVDVLPTHDRLGNFTERLIEAEHAGRTTEDGRYKRLFTVLKDAGIPEEYNTIVVDPPATAGPHLYNAVYTTRNLVVPVELSGKGEQSIAGLEALVESLEAELGIELGALAAAPIGYKHNVKAHDEYLERLEDQGFNIPVYFRERTSLFQGCWTERCSAWTYIDEHRSRRRDHEEDTLERLETLASTLERMES